MYFFTTELFVWTSFTLSRIGIITFLRYHRPQKLWYIIAVIVTACTRSDWGFTLSRFSGLHYTMNHTWKFCWANNTGPSQLHFLSKTTINGKPDKTVTSYCRHRWIGPMRPSWRFPSTNTSSKLHFLPTTTIKRKLNKTVPSYCNIHLTAPHFQTVVCM